MYVLNFDKRRKPSRFHFQWTTSQTTRSESGTQRDFWDPLCASSRGGRRREDEAGKETTHKVSYSYFLFYLFSPYDSFMGCAQTRLS